MNEYIIRVIDDNDFSGVVSRFVPGSKLAMSLRRRDALRTPDLRLAIELRDIARKQFKTSWVVYAHNLQDSPVLDYDALGEYVPEDLLSEEFALYMGFKQNRS